MADSPSQPLDLARVVVGLHRDGSTELIPNRRGPPQRIEGYTVGAPLLTRAPPHGGERHPDGDELLFLVSGRVTLHLEEDGEERLVDLGPGEAFIVPRGVWHRVVLSEPSQLVHITPGPRGDHRRCLSRPDRRVRHVPRPQVRPDRAE